jgi:hypothetical protein
MIPRLLITILLLESVAFPARLFTSGAETQYVGTASDSMEWTTSSGLVTTSAWAHTGTYSYQITNSSTVTADRDVSTNQTSGTHSWRIFLKTPPSWAGTTGDGIIWRALNSTPSPAGFVSIKASTQTVGICPEPTGTCAGATYGTYALAPSTTYRIDIRLLLSDTVGELEARVYSDGNPGTLLDTILVTGTDTLNTNLRRFRIGNLNGYNFGGTMYMDDIAWNDSSGTFQNTYPIGPGRVSLVNPGSNNTVTWTINGSCSTNYDCVDQLPKATAVDDTTFNSTTTVQTDRFNLATLPSEIPSDATMILLVPYMRMGGTSSTGTNTARYAVWDDGGSKSSGTTAAFCDQNGWSQVTATPSNTLPIDLSGKSKSAVASYNIGYEPVSLAQSCKVSALYANIEWVEAPSTPIFRRPPVQF